jgi:hypothetical protein
VLAVRDRLTSIGLGRLPVLVTPSLRVSVVWFSPPLPLSFGRGYCDRDSIRPLSAPLADMVLLVLGSTRMVSGRSRKVDGLVSVRVGNVSKVLRSTTFLEGRSTTDGRQSARGKLRVLLSERLRGCRCLATGIEGGARNRAM